MASRLHTQPRVYGDRGVSAQVRTERVTDAITILTVTSRAGPTRVEAAPALREQLMVTLQVVNAVPAPQEMLFASVNPSDGAEITEIAPLRRTIHHRLQHRHTLPQLQAHRVHVLPEATDLRAVRARPQTPAAVPAADQPAAVVHNFIR